MNFLIEGEDSDLELPELNDDSNYGHLANYVRRNERQQHARPEKLFKAVPDSEAVSVSFHMYMPCLNCLANVFLYCRPFSTCE